MNGIGPLGELREIVVESPTTTTAVVVVVSWRIGEGCRRKWEEVGSSGRRWNPNKTKHRKDFRFHRLQSFARSPHYTPCCTLRCFVSNRNPGVMAGLATSASISSFITWSTCSGHRSLNGLRSLATYTAAHRNNLRRVLDRATTVTGPAQISRVR